MLRKSYIALALTALVCLHATTEGKACNRQEESSSLLSISAADGLSNNLVLSMAQDGEGNVWVGTEAGLNRIAGFTISAFMREQMQYRVDKVQSLHYDKLGERMLIGTSLGLIAYDLMSEDFAKGDFGGDELVISEVSDIADDHNGGVWLVYSNGSIQHLDCKSNMVQTLNVDLPGSRSGMDDGKGHLYVGHSKEGMSIISTTEPREVKRYLHKEGKPGSLPGNNVRSIMQDKRGRIWVGTDCGLCLYDTSEETFTLCGSSDAKGYSDNVFDIMELSDGRVWAATDVGGIIAEDGSKIATSSMNTRCLLEDSFSNIWIGNHSTGISVLTNSKPFLQRLDYRDTQHQSRQVYGIANDNNGNIWVSSEDELCLFGKSSDSQSSLCIIGRWEITEMKHRAHSFARCIMVDSHGYVWLGMEDEGVIRFNQKTQKFEPIEIGYEVCDVHSFYEDTDGRIWIGAEYGVCIYDNGRVSHVETLNKMTQQAPVTSFHRLQDERLLVATQGRGVVVITPKTNDFHHLTTANGLPSNNINQTLPDKEKGFWLATSEGLVWLAGTDNLSTLEVYDGRNGLTDHSILAIQQDTQGRIWASTHTSIVCFDPQTKHFYNYSQQDNVNANGFMAGAAATTGDGHIVFGTTGGACLFQPKDTEKKEAVSPVRIALCEVYRPDEEGSRTKKIRPDTTGRLTTTYNENTLKISYTVADYSQAGNVDYSYKMQGLNEQWYYNGNDNDIMFRNLRPGKYTFMLRAKLKSQDWKEATTTRLGIEVTPPFWRTWWAYSLYAMALVAGAFVFVSQYKRRLELRNTLEMMRLENIQKQELNEERLRFFTNITHELRTPLTLILGPLEDLCQDTRLDGAEKRKVESIHKSAQRLRDLISEILEFRKTETQNRHLTVARGDIAHFVKEIVLNYQELNSNPKVQINLDDKQDIPYVYFDSEVITTVLNNLISNAIKYTEEGFINVGIETDKERKHVTISIADAGYGIDAEALPHIFERYYQAKGKHQASGTGIGLALAKALADLHEASLTAESKVGVGSIFKLTLQTDNTYPNALHKEDNKQQETVKEGDTQSDGEKDSESETPLLLIVEDNEDIRQYIAESLEEDFRIAQAENGEEGCEAALAMLPDIIVSDIMMPKMDGIEMTTALKNDIRTSHVPIILLTAKTSDDNKMEGYECGADSYLTKPFTAKLLDSRIKNLLSNRRRLAERLRQSQPEDLKEDNGKGRTNHLTTLPLEQLSRLDREFVVMLNRTIEESLTNGKSDIDMAYIASQMAMSHSTFYRKVKALTGLTANEYVRKIRLRLCKQLLASGDYNVGEAATMTGFSQMAHFREAFKKEFGMLPSEAQKK